MTSTLVVITSMSERNRPETNRKGKEEARKDPWMAVGSTVRALHSLSGDPFHANLSDTAQLTYDFYADDIKSGALDHKIRRIIKDEIFRDALRKKHRSEEDIPLELRGDAREAAYRDWKKENDDRDLDTLVEERKRLYLNAVSRESLRKTTRHIIGTLGPGAVVASVNTPGVSRKTPFDLDAPELVRIYTYNESVYLHPYITGTPSSGKTNFVSHIATHVAKKYIGYVRMFLPAGMKHPYSMAYNYDHAWEIFIDEPKGSSILWTVVDANYFEQEFNGKMPIYALLLQGEQGQGDQDKYMADIAAGRRDTYTIGRHFRIQFLPSGAKSLSVSDEYKIIDPMITCHSSDMRETDEWGENKRDYYVEIRYKDQNEGGLLSSQYDSVLHNIPPPGDFYSRAKKGLGLDMAGDFDYFRIGDLIKEARLYDNEGFDKDPDKFISAASEYVKEIARDSGFQWKQKKAPPKMDAFLNRQGDPVDEQKEKDEAKAYEQENQVPVKLPWE